MNVALPRARTSDLEAQMRVEMTARAQIVVAFDDLAAQLKRRGEGGMAFVQRKAPDLRLRLEPTGDAVVAETELAAMLTSLARVGVVGRFFPSVYEPESHLFGGPEATQAVHAHFDADTRALARWLRLGGCVAAGEGAARRREPRRPALPFTAEVFSLAFLNDLFFVATGGAPEEMWDVWCRLRELHGEALPVEVDDLAGGVGGASVGGFGNAAVASGTGRRLPVVQLGHLLPLSRSRDELRLVRGAAYANRRLAGGLLSLWRRGRLRVGLRGLLATVALFHWNRCDIGVAARVRILRGMRSALWPHRAETPPPIASSTSSPRSARQPIPLAPPRQKGPTS